MGLEDQFKQYPRFDVVPGYAENYPNIRVGGVIQPATWPDNVYAAPGESIVVGYIGKTDAPAQAVVLFRVGQAGPREGLVTAAPAGSDTVTVTANGVAFLATFGAHYTPVIGDRVRLFWQGRDVTINAKVGVTPVPPPAAAPVPTAPPPARKPSGTLLAVPSNSGTWSNAFGWANRFGQNVYQGNGSAYGAGSVNNGAFFYNGQFSPLAGTVVDELRFWIPPRNSAGAFATQTLHLYAHTSPNRPGGDVTRVAGPHDVTIPYPFGGADTLLPLSWASIFIAGGGVGMSGNPYMGFLGKGAEPNAGRVLAKWHKV